VLQILQNESLLEGLRVVQANLAPAQHFSSVYILTIVLTPPTLQRIAEGMNIQYAEQTQDCP